MPLLDYGSTFDETGIDGKKPQSWDNYVMPYLQTVRTLTNTTKFDYLNIQDDGLRTGNLRTHANVEAVRIKVRNATGSSIAAGSLVYFSGTYSDGTDSYPTITKAVTTTAVGTTFFAQATTTAAIGDGADGTAAIFLELTGQNTSGGTAGDSIYLDTTAGGWTRTRPTGGQYVQVVGTITVVHASTGRVVLSLGSVPEHLTGGSSGLGATFQTLTVQGASGAAADVYHISDAGEDNADKWKISVADGGNRTWENYTSGSYAAKLTLTSAGALTVAGALNIGSVSAAGSDTDKFLVLDGSGNVDYRTGAEVLSDIGGQASGSYISHDGSTANGVLTYKDADEATVESNLTFDGSTLAITGSIDLSADIDVDGTLEADAITLGGTALGSLYSPIAGSSSIVTVGTISTGVWQGTAVASAYLDSDTAHLSTTQTFTGDKTFTGAVQVGDATVASAATAADELVLEGSSTGMTISSSGTTNSGSIFFGDADNNQRGRVQYNHNQDNLILSAGAAEIVNVRAEKVGINISDPADYTDASGTVLVVGNTSGATTRSGVSIITDTSGIGRLAFGDGAGDPDQWKGVIQYTQSSDTMGFATAGNAVGMNFVGNNLGVGTASPTSPIHIKKSSTSAISLKVQNENTSAGADRPGTILLSGAADFDGYTHGKVEFQYVDTTVASIWGTGSGSTSGTGRGGAMRFYTKADNGSNTERMRITNAGNVGIGTTGPAYLIDAVDTRDEWVFRITNSNASPQGQTIRFTGAAPDDASQMFLYCYDTSANRTKITSDGDVWTSDSGILTSDERLKTNIVDTTSKLADVMRLRVRNFEWIPEYHPAKVGEKKIGFIAQELEEVFPKLILESDIAPDNSVEEQLYTADDDTQYYVDGDEIPDGKTVGDVKAESQIPDDKKIGDVKIAAKAHEPVIRKSYKDAFAPILVKALQEVTTRLEAAEAKIAALESA